MKIIALMLSLLIVSPSCAHAAGATKPKQPLIMKINFEVDVDESSADAIETAIMISEAVRPHAVFIRINSFGGDVDSGWRIIKAIRSSSVPVHCLVDGQADSMAFFILQSCTTRGMTAESKLLSHQPYFRTRGGPLHLNDLRTLLSDLQVTIDQLEIMASTRMKMPLAEYQFRNQIDWWMSSISALQFNAVDYVASNVGVVVNSLDVTGDLPK